MPVAAFASSRFLRFARRFGPRAALQAARMDRPGGEPVEVRLPGVAHPLWARPRTSDVATFDEIFLGREYDLPWKCFEPAHILDLGANVGYTSVFFALRWPRARVLAVEPDERNLRLLERNIRPWGRIEALRAAVWPHPAFVRVRNPDGDFNNLQVAESPDPGPDDVMGHTVAELIERLGCARLGLLKIDVEGAEAELFRGDTEWLDWVDAMVVELHDRLVPGCAEALCRALRGRRFRMEVVGRNLAVDLR